LIDRPRRAALKQDGRPAPRGDRSAEEDRSPMSRCLADALRHRWPMTLASVDLDALVDRARAAGLDGMDRGAVRRLIWAALATDAVDHAVVYAVADRLVAPPGRGGVAPRKVERQRVLMS
jgi:hypothetical protein